MSPPFERSGYRPDVHVCDRLIEANISFFVEHTGKVDQLQVILYKPLQLRQS